MIYNFTSGLLKTGLALAFFVISAGQSMAQINPFDYFSGPGSSTTLTGIKNNPSSNAKTNALVSRPGNSQDFIATGGNWQLESNSAYTYDANGNLLQRLYTDPATNQNLEREVFVYDAKNNEIEARYESWFNNAWDIQFANKALISYNANNQITESIYQYWHHSTSSWLNGDRQEIAYDAAGLRTTETYSVWDQQQNVWKMQQKQIYTNTGNTPTEMLIQQYDSASASWSNIIRFRNMTWYEVYDMPSAFEAQMYVMNQWINVIKYNAVFDANGGYVGVQQQWNILGNNWENFSRETETRDNQKNYTGSLYEDWDSSTNAWILNSEDAEVLTYSGIDIMQRVFRDSGGMAGPLEDRYKEVYSNFQTFNISGTNNILPETAVTIFPNPTTDHIRISFSANKGEAFTATLFDVTGKTWLTETLRAGENTMLNIETLPKGVYLLQLQTEAGSTVKRIVKQ